MSRSKHDSSFGLDAVLFDLDGVVTRTATLHAAAWAELFDSFLRTLASQGGPPFRPFDPQGDYLAYVDGKPRLDGVRAFLRARGIALPEGSPDDDPQAATMHGLAKRKDALFHQRLQRTGVEVFASTLDLIHALRASGLKVGVVTSSRNGREVLCAAGIADLFDARIDGIDADALNLRGKPAPDPFLACARALGAATARTVVVEDAVSGVHAGRDGGFGLVVGVDRGGNREALLAHGADIVVDDLAELDLARLHTALASKQQADIAWRIEQEGFDPAREHEVESNFVVGNGYLGVRGTLDSPLPISQGDLFIAGIYDRKHPERPYSEHEFMTQGRDEDPYSELVTAPFPFRLRLSMDGEPLDLAGGRWCDHRRILQMRQGMLHGHAGFRRDGGGVVWVRSRRCASAADVHLLLQEVAISPESRGGKVSLDASLDDPQLAANHPHLTLLDTREPDEGIELQHFSTQASRFEICVCARTTLVGSGSDRVRWQVTAEAGSTLRFRRYVAVYTSRDVADPARAAVAHVRGLRWEDFDTAMEAHVTRWQRRWERADVRVVGSPATEQALRFHAYHLLSAADHDPRVSVGARALTGRAYEGHVFWDVEVFMLPFYLHVAPDIARCLLLYRHHTLDGARRRAVELGYAGACYAWESTLTGEDVTPRSIHLKSTGKQIPVFTGTQQVHVSAGVAYGVWRYWEATLDREFLRDAGTEILAETARFWVSRCSRNGKRLHIRGVVGPDEYHHGVDDNAYTNWLARFNLEKAVWAVRWLRREFPQAAQALSERGGFSTEEVDDWAAAAQALYCPVPDAHGVIEQFDGFFDLEDYSLPRQERFKAPISRLFDWDRINRLKLIKQADVLMLLHLFPEAFPRAVHAANYRYYEPITDHGSSLSPAIHAAAAARLGLREDAERYWRQSLWLDLSNVMGNSALGVHPACMGGTWQALVFGFLGVRFQDDGPAPDPHAGARLPANWHSVSLNLQWRGQARAVEVTGREGR